MKHKLLTNLTSLIFTILLLIFAPKSYSQPANAIISPDEIQKTLNEVEQKPTNNETFDRRMKVIEAWAILSVASGKGDELRRITPPEEMQNIMSLKKDGKESEAFKKLDELYMKMERIGLPKIPSSLGQPQGKCGDGICDEFERANPDLCPQDCQPRKSTNDSRVQKTVKQLTRKPSMANVTVDYANAFGTFSPYIFGIKAAPYFDQTGYKLTKEVGFKVIEINTSIYFGSIPKLSDYNDSSQYNFKELDQKAEAAINNGLEPMIALWIDDPPSNLNDFATYTQNVAKHLTQGWGNGHYWNIKLFRFGNEADNPGSWRGTQQQFFETYATWAKALKKVNQNFILVALGLMDFKVKQGAVSDWPTNPISSWITNFLIYAKNNNVPVDIISIHGYGPVLYYLFYDNFRRLQNEINKYPTLSNLYGVPRIGNDEWNIILGDMWTGEYHKQFDTAWLASHNIAALINMIEEGVYLSSPMTGTFNGSHAGCHDFPLIDCSGKNKPSYYAFKGFNWLADTNHLSTIGTDHMNFAPIAGKSKDNNIIVVISNFDVQAYLDKYEEKTLYSWTEYNNYVSKFGQPKVYNKFNLTLNNLPWTSSQQIVYERYLVDDNHKLDLTEIKTLTGSNTISVSADMTAPSVQVIKIYLKK